MVGKPREGEHSLVAIRSRCTSSTECQLSASCRAADKLTERGSDARDHSDKSTGLQGYQECGLVVASY